VKRSESLGKRQETRVYANGGVRRTARKHDVFNERVLIAAALVSVKCRTHLVDTLDSVSFIYDKHAPIWAALVEVKRRGIVDVDPAMLRAIDPDVDDEYVTRLIAERPEVPANLDLHVSALRWDSACARVVEGPLEALNKALSDPSADPMRVKSLARQVSTAVESASKSSSVLDASEVVRQQVNDLDQRSSGIACYPYGIEGLDKKPDGDWRIVPGVKPGKITLVTAVSGSCKSTWTALLVLNQVKLGRRVLYGSWEMSAGETLELLAAIDLGLSRHRIATGQLTTTESLLLKQKLSELSQLVRMWRFPWRHDARPRYNDEVLDRIHAGIVEVGADVAVFDLWRRCLVDRRIDEEEAALERMQQIAEQTKCHQIICHQQRLKDLELRKDKRPTREGIKGTSVWVDVPDTIFGLHLPSLWKNIPADTLEIDVLKQRYGRWPIAIEFDWDGDTVKLSNAREVDYNEAAAGDGDALSRWVGVD